VLSRSQTLSACLAIALLAAATIGGALVSEHVFGYLPCMLCLWERWPYYIGVPLALLLALAIARRLPAALGFALLGAVFAVGCGLGVYHAGVEFGLWPGPASCGGGGALPLQAGDLLTQLRTTKVVPCDTAALYLLGLSLAAWNALIAGALSLLASATALRLLRDAVRSGEGWRASPAV
jgi:disulfide bond formation protein DsbB